MKHYIYTILLAVMPSLCMAQAETGELKGVVTFNTSNGGHRADAGAEVIVYLIDSVQTPERKAQQHAEDSIANNSFLATIYYAEWAHTPTGKTQKQMVRKLKAMDAWPEDKLHELDNVVSIMVRNRELKQSARAIADGSGNYSIKLKPGYYGIIFRSRHLRSNSRTEAAGNILLDEVVIRRGGTVVLSRELL